MRTTVFTLCAAALAACSTEPQAANPDYGPVDGKYVLLLTDLSERCTAKTGESAGMEQAEEYADERTEVDLFLRPDEAKLDLRHSSNMLPRPFDGIVEGLVRDKATVDFEDSTVSEHGTQDDVHIAGVITPTEAVFDFEERYEDTVVSCVFSGHAEGRARPLADPVALGGSYVAMIDVSTLTCADGSEIAPAEAGHGRFEAYEEDGMVRLAFAGGNITVKVAPPGESGSVAFIGDAAIIESGLFGPIESMRPVELSGTLASDGTDLRLAVDYAEFGPGCSQSVTFMGRKLVADRTAIDNDYRMKFQVDGDCLTDGATEIYGTANVMATGGENYMLSDIGAALAVELHEDGVFHGETGSLETQGFRISVLGHMEPPLLDYALEIEEISQFSGELCRTTVRAAGEVRYAFD